MEKRIFIIDDEAHLREWLKRNLKKDYQVETFSSAISALDAIRKTAPDIVLLDIGLPQMNGIEALTEIRKISQNIPVIMITAQQDINTVISAMKKGAYDYLIKPFDINRVRLSVQNALESVSLRKEVRKVHEKYLQENMPCFIGESNTIKDVMDFIGMVARSPDTPILILGETGTGKELIASAVHFNSPNAKGPFIPLNCAAIPKDLLESDLFGYEKGAFSGPAPKGKKD
ncbi:response regulator [Desulfobacterales bacterium HSG2]|nr:response regulator [Desulfobacterales bacterium HSG2]